MSLLKLRMALFSFFRDFRVLRKALVAHLGALEAQLFGLAVDALGTGALVVDGVIERPIPIQGDTHLPAQFPIEVLDTPRPFLELLVLTAGSCRLGKEQRTEKAL